MNGSAASRTNYIWVTVAIGGLLFGFDTAVISGAISLITSQFSLSTALEGWLVSSGLLGCIIGVAATGLISDRTGRKKTMLIAGIMFLLSAIACAFAANFNVLIAARLAGGIGVGMASVISPMYIAEFAPAGKRGRMIAYYQLAITIGILLAYFSNALLVSFAQRNFSGSMMKWFFTDETRRPMFLAMAVPSLVFFVLLLSVPESPRWLVGQFFPWLLEKAGAAFTFWIFALFSLVNFFFSRNVVKETSGKTLEEMEDVFIAPH